LGRPALRRIIPARRGAAGLPVAALRGRPAAPARRVLCHPGRVMTLADDLSAEGARLDPMRPGPLW